MSLSFKETLQSGRRILFDGGMGSELTARCVQPSPETIVSARDTVLAIHRAYREAGADVLITNTFSANPLVLAKSGDANHLSRYVAEACRLAREALGGEGFLAGDIGSTGEFLEPYGALSENEMRQAFAWTAEALAGEGVDIFLVETMTATAEMRLAAEACRSVAPELPLAVSMSFDPVPDGYRTNMGVSAEAAATAMAQANADVIGCNCGSIAPGQMADVVRTFRKITPLPILAQSNAGRPELRKDAVHYPLSPEEFAADCVGILAAGAQLVGGCC